jgi:hypothetical protein
MCLLHGDFHTMGGACWGVTLDFQLEHADLPLQEASDRYLAAVERKMLDHHLQVHLGAAAGSLG